MRALTAKGKCLGADCWRQSHELVLWRRRPNQFLTEMNMKYSIYLYVLTNETGA